MWIKTEADVDRFVAHVARSITGAVMTPGVLLKIVGHELKHALHEAGPGVRASTPDENVESHGPAYDDEGPTSQPEDPPPSKDPEGF